MHLTKRCPLSLTRSLKENKIYNTMTWNTVKLIVISYSYQRILSPLVNKYFNINIYL